MWQEKSIAFFMKNVQESGDKLLKRCKEVEQLAVFRDIPTGRGKRGSIPREVFEVKRKRRSMSESLQPKKAETSIWDLQHL